MMKTVSQVMSALKKKGSAQTRKIYARHGAPDDMFGVKIADLKVIAKQIKGNQQLASDLYKTGNSDAMYLAGIVADGAQMTKSELQAWARTASWYMISEYTVPSVAVQSPHARDLAIKWMDAKKPSVAACGWSTYAGLVAIQTDDALDLKEVKSLLKRVVGEIDAAADRVRYAMNGFVISVGTYVQPLLGDAKTAARRIGTVSVDMGETSCTVPLASAYIEKVEAMGRIGRKRKTIKC